ncbi:hypothetical protein [Herbaspirillum huttiense]|uniref:hypothetical protein n=1 Tax=Herbaspirillum huttiense TaxID=863372 RepID=UPI000584A1AC
MPAEADDARTRAMLAARAAIPPQALPELAERLRDRHGLAVQWQSFPGLAHGPMLPASLGPALRIAAGLAPWPGLYPHVSQSKSAPGG